MTVMALMGEIDPVSELGSSENIAPMWIGPNGVFQVIVHRTDVVYFCGIATEIS